MLWVVLYDERSPYADGIVHLLYIHIRCTDADADANVCMA